MNARQCDVCKSLYTVNLYAPDIRISIYTHPYGDRWVDLCPKCQKALETWLKNVGV